MFKEILDESIDSKLEEAYSSMIEGIKKKIKEMMEPYKDKIKEMNDEYGDDEEKYKGVMEKMFNEQQTLSLAKKVGIDKEASKIGYPGMFSTMLSISKNM